MLTDIEIAQNAKLRPIMEIGAKLGIAEEFLELYGPHKAKVRLEIIGRRRQSDSIRPRGKFIGVTGMNPTPYGEGKTVTVVGLVEALNRLDKKTIGTLRQPSLGPVFGIKGGATGGGRAQVLPMEDINLHFTGDFHAVAAAHNLMAAMADNHLFQNNRLGLDFKEIYCNRSIDMNDRVLRHIIVGLGLSANGITREGGFDIVAASEVMAALTLASDLMDLKARLGRIIIGLSKDKRFITAADLKAQGAMAVLLKDAIKPNLVQTIEGNPVLIHTGPFGNVAPGNSSVVADRIALHLADYVVTESGFGSECGFEKLVDLKCRGKDYQPDAEVLVVSTRALKWHGGGIKDPKNRTEAKTPNPDAVRKGCANMAKHIENVRMLGVPCVVAINVFETDSPDEITVIEEEARSAGALAAAPSRVHALGGEGGEELAHAVLKALETPAEVRPLYPLEWPIRKKIESIATGFYGAAEVSYSEKASKRIDFLEAKGYGDLPICIAKTPNSLSHDAKKKNRPQGFTFPIEEVRLYAGAGYILPLAGQIMTMPGLPEVPAAEAIDIESSGKITGLF
jgi:formate--tetrahydrofolate ligase